MIIDIDSESSLEPQQALEDEIADLQRRLEAAKGRLRQTTPSTQSEVTTTTNATSEPSDPEAPLPSSTSTHFLFLLSDSALPLGSFAFSSGLESYLAHNPRTASFNAFLPSSLSTFASSTLPFVLAAWRSPERLPDLDDQLDAAIVCTVGRRASVAQGRALLSIWERSFRPNLQQRRHCSGGDAAAASVLQDFAVLLRDTQNAKGDEVPLVSAHLAPLFGAICAIVGLTLRQTAYVFMLSHVKALISAAVRASMFGPYQAQKVLAGEHVQAMIDLLIDREWNTPVEEAGQTVPVMDLWIGRHELLYSRIFNS